MNIELTCRATSGVLCSALPLVYVPLYQKGSRRLSPGGATHYGTEPLNGPNPH
jgi:hypothetical protein